MPTIPLFPDGALCAYKRENTHNSFFAIGECIAVKIKEENCLMSKNAQLKANDGIESGENLLLKNAVRR